MKYSMILIVIKYKSLKMFFIVTYLKTYLLGKY